MSEVSLMIADLIRKLPGALARVPIDDVPFLPNRLKNALIRGRLAIVLGDLARLHDEEFLSIPNVGKTSVTAFVDSLRFVVENLSYQAQDVDEPVSELEREPSDADRARCGLPRIGSLAESLIATVRLRRLTGVRDAEICRLRFATPGGATLEEVAGMFGLTRERIRQVVARSVTYVDSKPVGIAIRSKLDAILGERDVVRVGDLASIDSWFASLPPEGLWALVSELTARYALNVDGTRIISRFPYDTVEGVLRRVTARLAAISNVERARTANEMIAQEESMAAGMPGAAIVLAAIGRDLLSGRKLTLSAFAADYVSKQSGEIQLPEICVAAKQHGLSMSEAIARNTLALLPGLYSLGRSTFGTIAAIFGEIDTVGGSGSEHRSRHRCASRASVPR